MSKIREYRRKIVRRFFTHAGREKNRIATMKRFTEGTTDIFGKKFLFHDNASFLDTYFEIFEKEIYKFKPGNKKTILDCGANIGLSVLYFAKNYPDHTIIAFEPDATNFRILEENVKNFNLKNVQLYQKAVWNKEEVLEFYTDHGMGGRVGQSYEKQEPVRINAVPLRSFLNDDIDFLKLDIEGAEYEVLKDCKDVLGQVNNIFFEYHNHHKDPQTLHELLSYLVQNNFRYYIKESSTRQRPFVDDGLICEIYDMAINVFAYRAAQ